MADSQPYIDTTLNFQDPRYRGFRQPHPLSKYKAPPPKPGEATGQGQPVRIYNARLLDPPATLATHGFQCARCPLPKGLDLRDPDTGRKGFYKYVQSVVKEASPGCLTVVQPSEHEYRTGHSHLPPEHRHGLKPTPNGSSGFYGASIHSDLSSSYEMDWKPKEGRKEHHLQIVKIWRSTDMENNVECMPLVFADMRTVRPEDIIYYDGQNTMNLKMNTKYVAMGIAFHPDQRWYYFPHLTPDEVLIFVQYDTRREEAHLRTVFHSAAWDPTTRRDAPPRYTIEAATAVIYEEEPQKAKAARVKRFLAQISSTYPDGTQSDWWSGPIEGYRPPEFSKL